MSYFTNFQEKLFSSYDLPKNEKEKLQKYLLFLEETGVGKIIEKETTADRSKGGRPSYNPYRLFASIVFAFAHHPGSLRKIEESLKFDLRFIYMMEENIPSYVTISKLLNNVVVKNQKEIYALIVKTIITKFDIDIDDCFIDGTKIEANANKYKFVYKPNKNKINLFKKIRELLLKYFSLLESKETFTSKEVGRYYSELDALVKDKGIDIEKLKTGKGHKNIEIVKDFKTLEKFFLKLLDYEEIEDICGDNRNSFYKTDKDATAMNLKKDYYSGLGSNMHACYNYQLIVSKGLILDYYVSQDRTDYYAFIPSLESFKSSYGFYPKRICADSGYGSSLNYKFIYEKNIENYVKFSDWRLTVSGDHIVLFKIDSDNNLTCINNKLAKKLTIYGGRHVKRKANFFYLIESCFRCKYKPICQKNLKKKANYRMFELDPEFYKHKEDALNNLVTPKGIEMRVNRSSQVEGAFGVIKEDMGYERARRRGLENVSLEMMLVCLGYNIKKLLLLLDGKGKLDYWKAPMNLESEKIVQKDINVLINKKKKPKGVNETLRNTYKHRKVKKKRR